MVSSVNILLFCVVQSFRREIQDYSHSVPSTPSGCGFGYDPKTDDYKYAELYLSNKALVYSLRNNSWKEIEANLKNNRCYTQPHGVCTARVFITGGMWGPKVAIL